MAYMAVSGDPWFAAEGGAMRIVAFAARDAGELAPVREAAIGIGAALPAILVDDLGDVRAAVLAAGGVIGRGRGIAAGGRRLRFRDAQGDELAVAVDFADGLEMVAGRA